MKPHPILDAQGCSRRTATRFGWPRISRRNRKNRRRPIGVYGQRRTFLKEHHRVLYDNLLNVGTLHDHLVDIEEQAQGDGLRLFCI